MYKLIIKKKIILKRLIQLYIYYNWVSLVSFFNGVKSSFVLSNSLNLKYLKFL